MDNENIMNGRQLRRTGRSSMEEGWVDSMVEVARVCNNLFTKHSCGICHLYVDKQVEFESRHEDDKSGRNPLSPVERVWKKAAGEQHTNLEVDIYRQFLFDEESVVSGVSHREDASGSS